MRPVLRVHGMATVGSIAGVVDPAAAEAMVWTIAGDDTVQTFADPLTGAFKLMALQEGLYDVMVTPQADGWLETSVLGVAVTARENTDLGTVVLDAE